VYLKVSPKSVYCLLVERNLPRVCIARLWRFCQSEVNEWVRIGSNLDGEEVGYG